LRWAGETAANLRWYQSDDQKAYDCGADDTIAPSGRQGLQAQFHQRMARSEAPGRCARFASGSLNGTGKSRRKQSVSLMRARNDRNKSSPQRNRSWLKTVGLRIAYETGDNMRPKEAT
jgi:hypothetical protein